MESGRISCRIVQGCVRMASAREYFRDRQRKMYSEEYQRDMRRHRQKVITVMVGTVAAVILLCLGIYYYNVNRTYDGYEVVEEYERTDGQESQYLQMDDKIIRYSMDGISCYDENYQVIWNQSYEMKKPMVDVCESFLAICDTDGTKFYVLGENGLEGEVETQLPIKRIEVAAQGVVAVLLEDSDINRINYYDLTGTMLAENKSPIEKSGYPMDISLSSDGMKMAVSYMSLESGSVKTRIAFYNFDAVGANEIDHLVSAQEYDGVIVPEIEFVNATTAVAFGNDFFDIFQGSQKPVEMHKEEISQEIRSVFYSEAYVGIVVSAQGEHPYQLRVYDLKGDKRMEMPFDIEYEQIKFRDDQVYMISGAQCMVYNLQGKLRFQGDFKENIVDVLPLKEDCYMVVTNDKVQKVRLK